MPHASPSKTILTLAAVLLPLVSACGALEKMGLHDKSDRDDSVTRGQVVPVEGFAGSLWQDAPMEERCAPLIAFTKAYLKQYLGGMTADPKCSMEADFGKSIFHYSVRLVRDDSDMVLYTTLDGYAPENFRNGAGLSYCTKVKADNNDAGVCQGHDVGFPEFDKEEAGTYLAFHPGLRNFGATLHRYLMTPGAGLNIFSMPYSDYQQKVLTNLAQITLPVAIDYSLALKPQDPAIDAAASATKVDVASLDAAMFQKTSFLRCKDEACLLGDKTLNVTLDGPVLALRRDITFENGTFAKTVHSWLLQSEDLAFME